MENQHEIPGGRSEGPLRNKSHAGRGKHSLRYEGPPRARSGPMDGHPHNSSKQSRLL